MKATKFDEVEWRKVTEEDLDGLSTQHWAFRLFVVAVAVLYLAGCVAAAVYVVGRYGF